MESDTLDYGCTVIVSAEAPNKWRPSELASVCGFWSDPEDSGTRLVLIEFGDGLTVKIPRSLLRLAPS